MRKLLYTGLLPLAALIVAGCPRAVLPPPAPEPAPAPAAPDTRGATMYEVDSGASLVQIHVYRGGTLARLGHNHVVASRELRGKVWVHPTFTRSGFDVSFPVATLIVDDPQLRAAAGPEFQSEIKPADKEGTRNNMLRAEVLDAERYPEVKVQAARIAGSAEAPQATARVTIRDASQDMQIPVKIAREGGRLRATGAFDLKQTDFGMKPFSVGLGALEVQDRLHIEFDVVANERE